MKEKEEKGCVSYISNKLLALRHAWGNAKDDLAPTSPKLLLINKIAVGCSEKSWLS